MKERLIQRDYRVIDSRLQSRAVWIKRGQHVGKSGIIAKRKNGQFLVGGMDFESPVWLSESAVMYIGQLREKTLKIDTPLLPEHLRPKCCTKPPN
ncbi:hypothetical protein [Veronia pacifica]|uniref:Uncharacterized protein n=1 Tax=Veronia pacifica TaxID=1080227 RepID=A0A1C3EDA3_9GAMM|nr:hypothetical protein [Veronia pacifica]ODA31232.1 hypothetical protein A8L45_17885 [Veronia pacifica]